MRRRLLVTLSVALAAGTLVVGTSAVTAGASTASKKLTKCSEKSAAKGLTKALNGFFTGETGEDKVKLVDLAPDQVDAVANAIQLSSDAAAAGGISLPVQAGNLVATCIDKKSASFIFDLENSETGDPLLPGQAGDGVLKKGKWLVSGAYVCDLTAQNPARPESGQECYAAIGLDVPTG